MKELHQSGQEESRIPCENLIKVINMTIKELREVYDIVLVYESGLPSKTRQEFIKRPL